MAKVVIVGGGFGGVAAAKALSQVKDCQVQLIDRRNFHLFQPLLYQVAMAGLNPSDIAVPLRKLFSKSKNIQVTLAEVRAVDIKKKRLNYDDSWHSYDYLILACGAKHFYFGNDDWELIAPGLKNIEQATEIRRRILLAFELAEKEEDKEKQKQFLTFVVVGGGPTGVELAGSIAEMASKTLKKDYRNADLGKTKVVLVEAGQRVLSAFPEALSQVAQKNLEQMGVEVITQARATELSKTGVTVGDKRISARTILWAAGVKPSSLSQHIESEKDAGGRLVVKEDLSLAEDKNVFVIGDQAAAKAAKGGYLPGIAPVALQQGAYVGRLIRSELKGVSRKPFKYLDKGIMATIGRSKAVVYTGGFQFHGILAWLIWVFVHILYLVSFKNKVFVFLQWVWAYFKFGRGARLIVHKTWRFYSGKNISNDY